MKRHHLIQQNRALYNWIVFEWCSFLNGIGKSRDISLFVKSNRRAETFLCYGSRYIRALLADRYTVSSRAEKHARRNLMATLYHRSYTLRFVVAATRWCHCLFRTQLENVLVTVWRRRGLRSARAVSSLVGRVVAVQVAIGRSSVL